MTNMTITFNSNGFREILCGEGVKNIVSEEAEKIALKANGNLTDPDSEGFEAEVFQGSMMSKYASITTSTRSSDQYLRLMRMITD